MGGTHARPHRLYPEKVLAYALGIAPAVWMAALAFDGAFGVRAVHEAVKTSGDWALRLFWLTLLVSPARRIVAAPRLIRARRILGVATFGLTLVHIGLYLLDLSPAWGQIVKELVLRTYLTIGLTATVGMAALAATSTDGAITRLGSLRWNGLHATVYVIAALSIVHFLLRSRTDTTEAMLMIGLLAWLLGYRLMQRSTGTPSTGQLFTLALLCAVLTAAIETGWYAAETGIDPWRVLASNVDFGYGIRPAWWVLLAGAGAALANWRWGTAPQRSMARISVSKAASGVAQGQSAS